MTSREIAKIIQRLLALAETGLIYSHSPYDKERYGEMRLGLKQLLSEVTDLDVTQVTQLLTPSPVYSTPLVDVRAFIVRDRKVLLVKDTVTGTWALPGGFCDVGFSPSENIVKELKEETGYDATCGRLLAVFDTNHWQFQAKQYVKLVYECQIFAGAFNANHEVSELAYFDIFGLPELSEKRITVEQMRLLWEIYHQDKRVYSD